MIIGLVGGYIVYVIIKVITDSKQLNQAGEKLKIYLQGIISNKNDEYVIAARDISYYIGYYNASEAFIREQ